MREKCIHGISVKAKCFKCKEEESIKSDVEPSVGCEHNVKDAICIKCLQNQIGVFPSLDRQEGGNHYTKLGEYQPWIVLSKWMTAEEMKGAMKKDVISYLTRESDKGGREDIKKAVHTMQVYLELTEEESSLNEPIYIYCENCEVIRKHKIIENIAIALVEVYQCTFCEHLSNKRLTEL